MILQSLSHHHQQVNHTQYSAPTVIQSARLVMLQKTMRHFKECSSVTLPSLSLSSLVRFKILGKVIASTYDISFMFPFCLPENHLPVMLTYDMYYQVILLSDVREITGYKLLQCDR